VYNNFLFSVRETAGAEGVMGKVGSIFRDAPWKGLTLEQVSDETNISRRFLQGIETDNSRASRVKSTFSAF
jgi:hypothetical protein